jgi:hypothetical protein
MAWLVRTGTGGCAIGTRVIGKGGADAKDLVIPDLMDGLVYPSRALLVCGFLSAYVLSERTLGSSTLKRRSAFERF